MEKKSSQAPSQQDMHAARARFIDGGQLPAALLPRSVARSWERSRDAGLLPQQAPQYELLGTSRSVLESQENRRLYSCVVDEIESLWTAFGGADWAIICVNPQATIVHARQSPTGNNYVLIPGRRMLESHIGTTAPSCVIHDGTEAIVAGGQHYLDEFERIFCFAVPLFGLHGEIIGALDLTGTGQRNVAQVREQFRLAALAAEQRLFATLRGCHLLRMQHDPRWLGTPIAGILAVENDGQVRAASRLARRMLSLPLGAPLASLDLPQLFADATPAQQRRLLRPARNAQRIARTDGSHLWVQYARAPAGRSTARRANTCTTGHIDEAPPIADKNSDDASLREQSFSAIQRALRDHDGNIAATARQLGISRTTVYTKLRQLRRAGILRDSESCSGRLSGPRGGTSALLRLGQ